MLGRILASASAREKKLIALAVAGLGLTGAAYAQSNVTIYGVVDNTFENISATGVQGGNRVSANSSYIGFKGEENLGNGLKAKFLFEQGLSTDDTKADTTANKSDVAGVFGNTASRDAWVSLSSDQFGEVRLGTFNRATRLLGSMVDYSWGYAGITTMKGVMGTVAGTKTGADERMNNAVGYFSPVFAGGLQLSAIYGAAEAKTYTASTSTAQNINNRAYDLGALYNNGPIKAGIAYARTYNGRTDAPGTAVFGTDNAYVGTTRIGGAYTFPTNTTLSAMWDNTKANDNTSNVSGSRNAWDIGVKQGFGANNVFAQFSKANKFNAGTVTGDNGTKQITVGYGYDFSKRTTLKAYWTRFSNGANGTAGFYDNAVAPTTAGGTARALGVGIRHSF